MSSLFVLPNPGVWGEAAGGDVDLKDEEVRDEANLKPSPDPEER